jgi:hypothetical protein
LGQHLDQLLSGVGTVVLVEGGAGMGKSRLLQETGEMAHRLSIGVGLGAADPNDTIVHLSALMKALFEGQNPILDRAALGDTHAPPEQRYWLLRAESSTSLTCNPRTAENAENGKATGT